MFGLVYLESNKYIYKVEFGSDKLPTSILRYTKGTKTKVILQSPALDTYQDLSEARVITRKRYDKLTSEY